MPSKVLVVDDDPKLCEFLQEVLTSAEMEAHALTDSSQAAKRLKQERFDAVFLDVRMSPPDGIELARQIRSSGLNETTPIVMITGDDDHTLLGRAFREGANFFLFKPIDRTRLLRLLRAAEGSIQREKRRFARVRVRCNVAVESGEERLNGMTLDLSLSGMLVQAQHVFPVGTVVKVSLELAASTQPIRGTARVARVVGSDLMGLQLENVEASESQRLQRFLLPLVLATMEEHTPSGRPA